MSAPFGDGHGGEMSSGHGPTEGKQPRELDRGLRGALFARFGEMPRKRRPGARRRRSGRRRPLGRTLLLVLAALLLLLGALACVALVVQTVNELRGPANATGNPDWVLALAAAFFAVMAAALVWAAYLVVRLRPAWLPVWVLLLIIGLGGAALGLQQLAAADWRAFSAAGSGAAIFLALSVYLVGVSGGGIWLKSRREPFPDEDETDQASG